MIASVCIETGIAPAALYGDPDVLEEIVDILEERARKAKLEQLKQRMG